MGNPVCQRKRTALTLQKHYWNNWKYDDESVLRILRISLEAWHVPEISRIATSVLSHREMFNCDSTISKNVPSPLSPFPSEFHSVSKRLTYNRLFRNCWKAKTNVRRGQWTSVIIPSIEDDVSGASATMATMSKTTREPRRFLSSRYDRHKIQRSGGTVTVCHICQNLARTSVRTIADELR